MSVINQYKNHPTKAELFKWVAYHRRSYYHKPSNNPKCIDPSNSTTKRDGTTVSNEAVVEEIKKVLSRFDFESYYESKQTIAAYMDFYNYLHLHGVLERRIPMKVWN